MITENKLHESVITLNNFYSLPNRLCFQSFYLLCYLCLFNLLRIRLRVPLETATKFPVPWSIVLWFAQRYPFYQIQFVIFSNIQKFFHFKGLFCGLSVRFGLLFLYGGLRDSHQWHRAALTRILYWTQIPRVEIRYNLCYYRKRDLTCAIIAMVQTPSSLHVSAHFDLFCHYRRTSWSCAPRVLCTAHEIKSKY